MPPLEVRGEHPAIPRKEDPGDTALRILEAVSADGDVTFDEFQKEVFPKISVVFKIDASAANGISAFFSQHCNDQRKIKIDPALKEFLANDEMTRGIGLDPAKVNGILVSCEERAVPAPQPPSPSPAAPPPASKPYVPPVPSPKPYVPPVPAPKPAAPKPPAPPPAHPRPAATPPPAKPQAKPAPAAPPPAAAATSAARFVTEITSGTSEPLRATLSFDSNAPNAPTVREFKRILFRPRDYPTDAVFLNTRVLNECSYIDRTDDGYTIIYQRAALSRHYVIAMKVVSQTDTYIKIAWKLVKVERQDKKGPYLPPKGFAPAIADKIAAKLNEHLDHIYTPYNEGGWEYTIGQDGKKSEITYFIQSNTGGSIPVQPTSGMLLAFPKKLLEKQWGITGEMK